MSEISKAAGDGQGSAGAYSLSEILSQPQCWGKCLQELAATRKIDRIREAFGPVSEWLFVGCGSSYYIALAAASTWSEVTGRRVRAIPASELMLNPQAILAGSSQFVPVLISRSGRTSEVLQVAEFLRAKNIPTLAISCAPGQPLEQLATQAIVLTPADEQSTVMTRSFTSMLLALQYLSCALAGKTELLSALEELPAAAEAILNDLPQRVRDFAGQNRFADYVCLGQGAFYGLACESALKLTEMSCSYGQSFHTLEFRHGPKSIVSRETLVTFLLSERSYDAEREMLEEVRELGGTTVVIANKVDSRARAAADFLVELALPGPELVRLVPYIFVGQLMGLYTGLKKGLDPDRPRNLSRVVILKEDRDKPQHASI